MYSVYFQLGPVFTFNQVQCLLSTRYSVYFQVGTVFTFNQVQCLLSARYIAELRQLYLCLQLCTLSIFNLVHRLSSARYSIYLNQVQNLSSSRHTYHQLHTYLLGTQFLSYLVKWLYLIRRAVYFQMVMKFILNLVRCLSSACHTVYLRLNKCVLFFTQIEGVSSNMCSFFFFFPQGSRQLMPRMYCSHVAYCTTLNVQNLTTSPLPKRSWQSEVEL